MIFIVWKTVETKTNEYCSEVGATSCDVAALRYYVIVYMLLLRYSRRHITIIQTQRLVIIPTYKYIITL